MIKSERLLEKYLSYAPSELKSFMAAMLIWLKEKSFLKSTLKIELSTLADCNVKEIPPLQFAEHHKYRGASAYYFRPVQRSAVLCLDGVG
jgi:carbamoyltransferase